ncbi:MAG: branched-chain amino acid aminotransferase [Candidatus Peregrinibacteria bacterium Greene0416_62]|nr:MAG: branched-chain amino acid aminotransferase [Candidatus Peregrinibacteria bacterium Greene0416_62]TSC97372.1 MAG: branched-chain amino acid aminotransferase [Candidatus Peregrinibacteria bacterium Greene1014_49]
MPLQFCVNGKFLDEREANVSVMDHGFLYSDGFYDTMRTYSGVVLELELHLDRIEHYAEMTGIPLIWGRRKVSRWIQETIQRNHLREARVRVTLTRGVNHFDFIRCKRPTLTIICEELTINTTIYKGVSASTMKLQRIYPEVKTIGITGTILAYRKAAKTRDFEMIFIGDRNMVREGAGSNVFIVKKGILYTPVRAILKGLTRRRVIALAKKSTLPVRMKDFSERSLGQADEIFVTNGLWELVPIVRLNGKKVGKGQVGPVTRRMMAAYREYVAEQTQH